MWGLSFDDMAKKAAELQTQAAHAAESLAHSTPVANFSSPKAFFNLDGIQKEEEESAKAAAAAAISESAPPVILDSAPPSMTTKDSSQTESPSSNETSEIEDAQTAHGELRRMETPPVVNIDRDQETTDIVTADITPAPSADGWEDDDNISLEDEREEDHAEVMEMPAENGNDHDGDLNDPPSTASGLPSEQSDVVEPLQPAAETEETAINSDALESMEDVSTAESPESTSTVPQEESVSQPQETEEAPPEWQVDQPNIEATEETNPPADAPAKTDNIVSDEVLENFSLQLKRLEENFAAERSELMQQHAAELQQLKASFTHDECQAQRLDQEEIYKKQVDKLEERLHDVGRKNEGYRLKIDMLQREVDGTKRLLEERDGDIGKSHDEHSNTVKGLQERLQAEERRSYQFEQEAKRLKENLQTAENDAVAQQKQHSDLKERMKSIALELKERRQECRQLKTQTESQSESNEQLKTEIETLRLQLSNHGLNSTEKDEELEQLKSRLVDAQEEINKAHKALKEQEAQAEKVLADYKKKAQNSLALSNSRAAAAVQAKEEAELEARSARSTADSAMDKAVQAELAAKKEVAEARHRVQEMETEKVRAVSDRDDATQKLNVCEEKLEKAEQQLRVSQDTKDQTAQELQSATAALREHSAQLGTLQAEFDELKQKESSLRRDLSTARDELHQLRKTLAAAQAAAMPPAEDEQLAKPTPVKSLSSTENDNATTLDDETITMFQRDLQDARESNEELRQALANVIAENERLKERQQSILGKEDDPDRLPPLRARSSDAESTSTPLFYAIEKQAELKTARDEIARLANFLSKVQSEKSEAEEAMASARQRLEEMETRLKLFEKFGRQAESSEDNHSNGNGNGVAGMNDSSIVNIEYLKNIMLRYLNAKSVKEKKALVPAIGAVLEFTSDEQRAAIHSVEEGASLGGVGSTLFETISFKLGS